MIRSPVYIAGPYFDPNPLIRSWNVGRACGLARLAAVEGLAPICVHPGILPTYGPETPATRALGMAVDVALVEVVARHPLGRLWILELESGDLSPGVTTERQAWRGARQGKIHGRRGTWADYRQAFLGAGLGRLWDALATPPTAEDLAAWLETMAPGGGP